jgi:replicative DNA helicase
MNFYLTRETELTLLGNWIHGRHREDIGIFDKDMFSFRDLYKAAVDGTKTLTQLYAEDQMDDASITEIMAATFTDFPRASYLEAKAYALTAQRDSLASLISSPGADVQKITEQLLQIQAIIDQREAQPAATHLSENFIKEIDEEAAATKMKFGRGFKNLNRRVGGIRRGNVIVLAARPATGKSAAALQIGYNIASEGAKVLFFPLEMTTQETLERLILQEEIVDGQLALKAPNDNEKADIIRFLDGVEEEGKFLIYEGVNQLETIRQTIKEQQPDLVIIDQLTQVRISKRTKDIRERYVEATAEMKAMAMELNTAILVLTQLNREGVKGKPTLENLHESDATGQNADVVLIMTKQEENEKVPEAARSDEIVIDIVKNRQGESGRYVKQKFYGNKFRFYDVG